MRLPGKDGETKGVLPAVQNTVSTACPQVRAKIEVETRLFSEISEITKCSKGENSGKLLIQLSSWSWLTTGMAGSGLDSRSRSENSALGKRIKQHDPTGWETFRRALEKSGSSGTGGSLLARVPGRFEIWSIPVRLSQLLMIWQDTAFWPST